MLRDQQVLHAVAVEVARAVGLAAECERWKATRWAASSSLKRPSASAAKMLPAGPARETTLDVGLRQLVDLAREARSESD